MIQISNQEMWRRAYAQRPYLQFSSEQEIAARLRYLMENMTTLLPDGKVGMPPPEPHGKMLWSYIFQNVLDEYARRNIKPPKDFLKDAHTAPHLSRSARRCESFGGNFPSAGRNVPRDVRESPAYIRLV
jgi:hypothetical protein